MKQIEILYAPSDVWYTDKLSLPTIYFSFNQFRSQNLKIRLFFRKQPPDVGRDMSFLQKKRMYMLMPDTQLKLRIFRIILNTG